MERKIKIIGVVSAGIITEAIYAQCNDVVVVSSRGIYDPVAMTITAPPELPATKVFRNDFWAEKLQPKVSRKRRFK